MQPICKCKKFYEQKSAWKNLLEESKFHEEKNQCIGFIKKEPR